MILAWATPFKFYQCGDRLQTSESDVNRRHILTSKYGPRAERVNAVIVSSDLSRFLHNHGNITTERSTKSGLCPTLIQ